MEKLIAKYSVLKSIHGQMAELHFKKGAQFAAEHPELVQQYKDELQGLQDRWLKRQLPAEQISRLVGLARAMYLMDEKYALRQISFSYFFK